jgi:hypothetical protein
VGLVFETNLEEGLAVLMLLFVQHGEAQKKSMENMKYKENMKLTASPA